MASDLSRVAAPRAAPAVTQRVWQRMIAANPDIPPPGGLRWLDA